MFSYEKMTVYQEAKEFVKKIYISTNRISIDSSFRSQLNRSALSICLNIAEGSSRYSLKDRRRFLIISRGSVFESAALIDLIFELKRIDSETHQEYQRSLEKISKSLYAMIRSIETE